MRFLLVVIFLSQIAMEGILIRRGVVGVILVAKFGVLVID